MKITQEIRKKSKIQEHYEQLHRFVKLHEMGSFHSM